MRITELTEKNIGIVYDRLKKFFNNEKYGYESYHNFDCGYRRIKPYYGTEIDRGVDVIELDKDITTGKPYIRINFQKGVSGTVYEVGSRFIFKGSEIIVRKDWYIHDNYKYIYDVYRLHKLTEKDIYDASERREYRRLMDDDYYDKCDNFECDKFEEIDSYEEDII